MQAAIAAPGPRARQVGLNRGPGGPQGQPEALPGGGQPGLAHGFALRRHGERLLWYAQPMFPDRFATARLILRPIQAGDADAVFEDYAQDPAVSRFLSWRPHASVADTRAFIADCLVASSLSGVYALTEREGDRLVGA